MPSFLSSKAKALFAAAKVDYLAIVNNTPANVAKFDQFLSNIDSNRSLASAINDQVDTKTILDINVVDSNPSGGPGNPVRDNYRSGLLAVTNVNGVRTYSSRSLNNRWAGGGTITFSTLAQNSPA